MDTIENFFQSKAYAVIGASSNRDKYGNKVLRCYLQHNKKVYPINPNQNIIEGLKVLHSIDELNDSVKSISIITPPVITEKIVLAAIKKGIKNIWMQPGAESVLAIQTALDNKINLIAEGPCILVYLGFRDI